MKKILLLLCVFTTWVTATHAQLTRYKDVVFANVKVTANVKYGSNIPFASNDPKDLFFDIYEPDGDTTTRRPVIILIHSGSFLAEAMQGGRTPAGTKEDHWLKEACTYYAKRGYVAVSLTHRIGWNPTLTNPSARAKSIFEAVWRARQDLKAGVRYLRKEANTYRIDVNRIAAGGSSSGGYVAVHAEFLDKPSELVLPKFLDEEAKSFIDTVKLGGFEGESGNPGFSSKIHAVICIGGAVGDTLILEKGDVPVIAAHGIEDKTTPYKTSMVVTAVGNIPIIEVSGSHDLLKVNHRLGNQKKLVDAGFNDQPFPGLKPFEGENFEFYNWWNVTPEAEIPARQAKLNSVLDFITPRLFAVLDLPTINFPKVVGRLDNELSAWSIYPNPTQGNITLTSDQVQKIQSVTLTDIYGRLISTSIKQADGSMEISWDHVSPGIYFLQINTSNRIYCEKIMVE
jgi:hypothetical protein